VAVLAGKMLRVPSVVWLVNGELIGLREIGYGADLIARQKWMNALLLKYADALLCGCEQMVRTARTRNPNARVELLPLGVNTERFGHTEPREISRFARNDNSGDAPHFVNVGSLLPVKDQATLLRALALVTKSLPHARLTIVGVGALEIALRALTRELNLEARVMFAGNVPHDELAALYQNAAVFVQASRHEGQGMAVLEAGACGCAMCGTNVGALADLARAGAAMTCAPCDAHALAETMLRAYAARAGLRERARQSIEQEYNLAKVGARLETLYARVRGEDFSFEHNAVRA
jgi:glycosyltransferase involved in cell wall biosynthesis